ncbi:MAG TPA: ACP phosphodiesterase [Cyclobacteriaceae bacterium]|nr:ACP phosphodiesterase [Cyclobacteriaceae bacterium]HMV10930.1 ACP phosphodiesterase [Cyclobacteriaceae bacterium]HMV89790.1 ACP phosphodiesterase [Cyclobacteriaceae bacterium]HMX02403.1 ACP phosphodiesterase [Cyclobacteriaceae bacterium]HMX52146.1 ACP phosphodiesterase [Cyclobacteriaceae bacterium]
MNFLAHLYLSGNNPKIMIGNFMGDFVKGRAYLRQYDSEIIKGIDLHRSIDEFTDSHPIVTHSKNRLRPKYRHYSGVIVDVFYDHFLAANWNQFHSLSLEKFAQQAYQTIESFDAELPAELNHMMPYMINGNWLLNYSNLEGIHRALSGMARRTPYQSKMEEAVNDLREHHDAFKSEFMEFFPLLEVYCNDILSA